MNIVVLAGLWLGLRAAPLLDNWIFFIVFPSLCRSRVACAPQSRISISTKVYFEVTMLYTQSTNRSSHHRLKAGTGVGCLSVYSLSLPPPPRIWKYPSQQFSQGIPKPPTKHFLQSLDLLTYCFHSLKPHLPVIQGNTTTKLHITALVLNVHIFAVRH
jgi:hypothetical protein